MMTPFDLCSLNLPAAYPRNAASTRNWPVRSCHTRVFSGAGRPGTTLVVKCQKMDSDSRLSLEPREPESPLDFLDELPSELDSRARWTAFCFWSSSATARSNSFSFWRCFSRSCSLLRLSASATAAAAFARCSASAFLRSFSLSSSSSCS